MKAPRRVRPASPRPSPASVPRVRPTLMDQDDIIEQSQRGRGTVIHLGATGSRHHHPPPRSSAVISPPLQPTQNTEIWRTNHFQCHEANPRG
jgi:hypothetical protein